MKETPPEKIYEAWSAVSSGRVLDFSGDARRGAARVLSSDGDKTYDVSWRGGEWASNDPASWWHGYPGYPILAVMTRAGVLPYDAEIAARFADVKWKRLNKKYGNDYAAALAAAEDEINLTPAERASAAKAAARALEALREEGITVRRYSKKRAALHERD